MNPNEAVFCLFHSQYFKSCFPRFHPRIPESGILFFAKSDWRQCQSATETFNLLLYATSCPTKILLSFDYIPRSYSYNFKGLT
jgi:hypothetical protein